MAEREGMPMRRRHWLQAALGSGLLLPAATHASSVRPRALVFPRDHGAHPDTRIEWWYLTGELRTEPPSPAPLGFQVTFFRTRTGLGPHPSRFAAQQLLFAHAAISDVGAERLRHDQRIAREGFGIAEAGRDDTALVLRDWQLRREPGPDGGHYHTRIASPEADFAFELQARCAQPLLLQGEGGFSRKGPGEHEASHYYSVPQLQVQGRLQRDGRWTAVRGRAWLDHEWSDTLMHPQAVGWDWIGMNLDDGGALTAFRLRRADGSSLWSGGSHRSAGGDVQDFGGGNAVRFAPGRRWTSPATRASYPVQWTLDTPVGAFEVQALMDAQELDSRASTGSIYWEGLSELRDAAGRRVGRGYLEMTGYASPLVL